MCLCCDRFYFMQVGFFQLMCLKHILSCVSIVIDFSLRRSSFLDSHVSITFYLIPLPWQISLYTCWVFLTYVLRAYFILCLYHSEFLFMRVGFSWLMCLRYILSCAFIMIDLCNFQVLHLAYFKSFVQYILNPLSSTFWIFYLFYLMLLESLT